MKNDMRKNYQKVICLSLNQKTKSSLIYISLVYSSSKANEFLAYDKCMQRMKCPPNRKEECSEECKAGK